MGKIVKFDMKRNKERNKAPESFVIEQIVFSEMAKKFEESYGEENVNDLLDAMKKLAHEVSEGPEAEELIKRSAKRQKEFLDKYIEIIAAEPKFDAGLRMQYYAHILLKLANEIFHAEDGFYKPLDDFSFFMDFFDLAFSKYSSKYSELEKAYCFTGKLTYDIKVLESMFTDCLEGIIQLRPNKSDYDKTQLLHNGNRLSELYCNLLYYHSDVIMKNKKQ